MLTVKMIKSNRNTSYILAFLAFRLLRVIEIFSWDLFANVVSLSTFTFFISLGTLTPNLNYTVKINFQSEHESGKNL